MREVLIVITLVSLIHELFFLFPIPAYLEFNKLSPFQIKTDVFSSGQSGN